MDFSDRQTIEIAKKAIIFFYIVGISLSHFFIFWMLIKHEVKISWLYMQIIKQKQAPIATAFEKNMTNQDLSDIID